MMKTFSIYTTNDEHPQQLETNNNFILFSVQFQINKKNATKIYNIIKIKLSFMTRRNCNLLSILLKMSQINILLHFSGNSHSLSPEKILQEKGEKKQNLLRILKQHNM